MEFHLVHHYSGALACYDILLDQNEAMIQLTRYLFAINIISDALLYNQLTRNGIEL